MPQFTFTQEATSPGAGQVHAASDDLPQDEGISGTYRVRVIDGDVGVERETGGHIVIVAAGEAEVQSFCTGDTLRLAGPGTLGLPTCQFDISGRWQGTYARRLSDGSLESVPFSLTLRKESGNLRGELNTPDGTFNIVSGSHSDPTLVLDAEGTVAGRQRRIRLSGNVTKGGMMLEGSEDSPPSVFYKIIGFAERLYIADSSLPTAVISQPYSFTLLAISPSDEALTFRLVSGGFPRGITLDGQTGTLSGTPTELGNFNVMVAASDSAGKMFEQPLTLAVKKLVVTTRLPDAYIGQRYAATLKAAGGRPPYQFLDLGSSPPGLQLNPSTGELTGTPTIRSLDLIRFTVKVLDSQNNFEFQDVSLRVRGTTIMNSHFLPEATLGVPYRTQFQTIGNSSPVQWSIAEGDIGSTGLTLSAQTGELSGTPIKAGNFLVQVQVQDQRGHQSRDFILTIEAGGNGLAGPSTAAGLISIEKLSALGLLLVPVLVGFAAYQARRHRDSGRKG
ncbi:MAG: putative Ig domain-containing protein [Acidobacteria bacterium]|nr:putative Ig domain-containing protein [Acidobacteriota bacterium]